MRIQFHDSDEMDGMLDHIDFSDLVEITEHPNSKSICMIKKNGYSEQWTFDTRRKMSEVYQRLLSRWGARFEYA